MAWASVALTRRVDDLRAALEEAKPMVQALGRDAERVRRAASDIACDTELRPGGDMDEAIEILRTWISAAAKRHREMVQLAKRLEQKAKRLRSREARAIVRQMNRAAVNSNADFLDALEQLWLALIERRGELEPREGRVLASKADVEAWIREMRAA
jgi:prefoldin subunit 5